MLGAITQSPTINRLDDTDFGVNVDLCRWRKPREPWEKLPASDSDSFFFLYISLE